MAARHSNRCSRRRTARGFSLVELMVAMALSLILLAGVLAIFASSRTTYETTDRLSRIQESGRFALDSIVRDLRSAGYIGCSRRAALTNTLGSTGTGPTTAANSLLFDFATPVEGFDAQGTGWVPALNSDTNWGAAGADAAGDVLVARIPRGDFEPVRALTRMNDEMDVITVPAAPALLKAGDIVHISDCEGRAVFQISAYAAGVITHAAVAPFTDPQIGNFPGNSTNNLGRAFSEVAEIVPMESVVYYLRMGTTPGAGMSLWRRVSGSAAPEELVEGVEAFEVEFGEETGNVVTYRRADQVPAANWGNVATVRIALLVRSLSEYGTDVGPASYRVLNRDVANPGDRHMRQVFTTTVSIRNRAI